ncbi:zinc transporter ZIP5 [Chelonoidis abingdonii]|uniref:zinc transporter ZIP5 n=1 Tax=Chelonoidis abingdonii TaxID=106734 RepID=UPI0013F23ED9|nr:zinc transporter ZIP5 [Chelonoidis abingdonii]
MQADGSSPPPSQRQPPPTAAHGPDVASWAGSFKATKQEKLHLHLLAPHPIAPHLHTKPMNRTEPSSWHQLLPREVQDALSRAIAISHPKQRTWAGSTPADGPCPSRSVPGSLPMDWRKPWLLLAGLWVAALLLLGECQPPPSLPARAPAPLEDAEQEQGYYLQQLFGVYGENGTLSFHGLTRLLQSLGLGHVQVVEMEHEALGHGHVTHLDILEVQDNKHRHSHSALEHAGVEPPSLGPGLQRENSTSRSGSPGRNQPETVRLHQADPMPRAQAASGGTRPPLDTEEPNSTGHPGSRSDPVQAPPGPPRLTLLERVLALDHSIVDHLHEDCLNVTQLLVNFGLNTGSQITPEQFTLLCPALLYQIDSRVCIRHQDQLTPDPSPPSCLTLFPLAVLGWGFLAITVISLPSALALLLVPFLGRDFGHLLLAFLVALAVGTLCGDALLHLWPHAQGRHQETPREQQDSVLKGLSVLGGIYLLFLIEHLLGTLKHRRRQASCAVGQRPGSPFLDADRSCGLTLQASAPSPGTEAELQHLTAPGPRSDSPGRGEEGTRQPVPSADGQTEELSHHGHSHGPAAGSADIAWMVILGDGIHNLTDGLAIGAAFSDGVSSGLSTTVAVFCHELPHELGDLAMLLQAGLPVKRVLFSNLTSAFLAYLGMAVGTVISQGASPITPWIFSITAGIFLYVALVDMLPEMLRRSSGRSRKGPVTYFALQNLGFLLGVAIMLCIALFEEQMSFRVNL